MKRRRRKKKNKRKCQIIMRKLKLLLQVSNINLDSADQPARICKEAGFPKTQLLLARLHEVQKSYCNHPGRTRYRSHHTLLKFSRSLYLDNQLASISWQILIRKNSYLDHRYPVG